MNTSYANTFTLVNCLDEIIENNINEEEFGVDELAVQIGLSRSTLQRRMKATIGSSPGKYLRSSRLKKARRLLRQTSVPISQIAYECGFKSLSYFDASFKVHFDCSPGEFRKLSRVRRPSLTIQ